MNGKKLPVREILSLIAGEVIVCAVTIGVYLLLDLIFGKEWFSYKVVTGSLLGAVVVALNFIFMSVSTSKAFERVMEARGNGEMSDEEIEKFTAEQKGKLQNTVKLSYVVRNACMLICLVVALLTKVFDVIATLVPFLLFRPIITVIALLMNRRSKNGS